MSAIERVISNLKENAERTNPNGDLFEIESVTASVMNLLTIRNAYFDIPEYQREYKWSNSEIKDLMNDLLTGFDNSEAEHFYGPIMLDVNEIEAGKISVIEGQQRLITSFILLSVIRSLIEEFGDTNSSLLNSIMNLIYKPDRSGVVQTSKARISFNGNQNDNFITALLSGAGSNNFGKNYRNIRKRLIKFLQIGTHLSHKVQILTQIKDRYLHNFVTVVICSENEGSFFTFF